MGHHITFHWNRLQHNRWLGYQGHPLFRTADVFIHGQGGILYTLYAYFNGSYAIYYKGSRLFHEEGRTNKVSNGRLVIAKRHCIRMFEEHARNYEYQSYHNGALYSLRWKRL